MARMVGDGEVSGKRILEYALISLLLSGTLFYTDRFGWTQPLLMGSSLLLMVVLGVVINVKVRLNTNAWHIFMLLSFFSIVSSGVNSDVDLLLRAGTLFLSFIGCVVLVPPLMLRCFSGKAPMEILVHYLFLSHYPLVVLPLLTGGFVLTSWGAYQGMFYNPNALGLVIITILAAHFAEVIDVIENWVLEHRGPSRLFLFTRIIGMTCLLFLIIMSRSRTAIITFGVLFIVSLFVIVSHGFDKGKINVRRFSKGFRIATFSLLIILLLYFLTPLGALFERNIISKFLYRSSDILDGRGDVWRYTIEHATLFGHGRGFFDQTISAHNTYISLLGQYGIIPTCFFIIFQFHIFRSVLKFSRKANRRKLRHFPLLIFMVFNLLSMTEGMLYKASMYLEFMSFGIASYELYVYKRTTELERSG